MPIELSPSGPESNFDYLLGIAKGHTVLIPPSAVSGGPGGAGTIAGAGDFNTAKLPAQEAEIALKADTATVNAALANKADGPTTAASLAAKQPAFIAPRTEAATVTMAAADNGGVSVMPVNCVVTVNTGLPAGFGRGFMGPGVVTFAGSATIVDRRTTGATNPSCALVCVGADTYWVYGSKA